MVIYFRSKNANTNQQRLFHGCFFEAKMQKTKLY